MKAGPSEEERFADWVDGRLGPAELARLERDLERDPELRRRAVRYRATVELVRRSADTERAPEGLIDAVVERLPARGRVGGHGGMRSLPPAVWRAVVPSAAVAAVLGAFLLVLWNLPTRTPTEQSTAAAPEALREESALESLDEVEPPKDAEVRQDRPDETLGRTIEDTGESAGEFADEGGRAVGNPETLFGGVKVAEPAQPAAEADDEMRAETRLGVELERKLAFAPVPEATEQAKAGAPPPQAESAAPPGDATPDEPRNLETGAPRTQRTQPDDVRGRRAADDRDEGRDAEPEPPVRREQPEAAGAAPPVPSTGKELQEQKAQPQQNEARLRAKQEAQRASEPPPAAKPAPAERSYLGYEDFGAKLVVVALPAQEERTRRSGAGGAAGVPDWITAAKARAGDALAIDELTASAIGTRQDAAGGSELRDGDRLFAITGSPEQLALYFADLGSSVATLGGKVDLRRTAPGSALSNAATQQREKVAAKSSGAAAASLDTVLLVWRPHPAPRSEKK